MTQNKIELFADTISRIAGFVTRDFPDVEREDLTQELYLFLLKQKELETPDQQGAYFVLMRKAKMIAWDVRKKQLHLTPQYAYRMSDLRAILETVFDPSEWKGVQIPEGAYSEYGDLFLVVSADVKRAWGKLKEDERKIIFERYALDETFTGDGTRQKRLSRAILALQEELNYRTAPKHQDYVGTRRVIGNAEARYRIDSANGEG